MLVAVRLRKWLIAGTSTLWDIYFVSILYTCNIIVLNTWPAILMYKIGQNDHSNPYIESTTVLSDIPIVIITPGHLPSSCCTAREFNTVKLGWRLRFFRVNFPSMQLSAILPDFTVSVDQAHMYIRT